MKPTDWIALIAAVNNGWAFAAFVIVVLLIVYSSHRTNRSSLALPPKNFARKRTKHLRK